MSRTLDETLTALDNLTTSWRTLGHAVQYKLQVAAMAELREHLTAPMDETRSRSDRRRRKERAMQSPTQPQHESHPPPPPPDQDSHPPPPPPDQE